MTTLQLFMPVCCFEGVFQLCFLGLALSWCACHRFKLWALSAQVANHRTCGGMLFKR